MIFDTKASGKEILEGTTGPSRPWSSGTEILEENYLRDYGTLINEVHFNIINLPFKEFSGGNEQRQGIFENTTGPSRA
jgi:hypothetical protein